MIGAKLNSINKAENRQLFNEAMERIGLSVAKNAIVHTLEEARDVLDFIGLPAIIRPSFTMGGTGGGIAYNKEEFELIVASGLDASPTTEVLIDESLLGWKEYEMEVVRDNADNCIIVCSIENVDPMGVHTGDSITVAPALTLTDKEYQIMRDASLAVLREIGVDTGGSNVQFAVNPENGRMIVIEMNPRVSRSSALASKATGFPIAKVAAKLAVGYTLDEITNDVTKTTPASFEPSIDYVVTKIPRLTFEKFPGAEPLLTTAMKSVGEAMSIGRSFAESLQKALRSMETGLTGLNDQPETIDQIRSVLGKATPDRLLKIAHALRLGLSVEEINTITSYDPWFIRQLQDIVNREKEIKAAGKNILTSQTKLLATSKSMGFSDARIAELIGAKATDVRKAREQAKILPVYKRVDTCAAEFDSNTSYMYSTYEPNNSLMDGAYAQALKDCGLTSAPSSNEATPTDRKKVIILGGGPTALAKV